MIETAVPKDEADRYGLSVIDGVEIEEKHQTINPRWLAEKCFGYIVIGISTKLRLRKKKRSQPNVSKRVMATAAATATIFCARSLKVGANELGRSSASELLKFLFLEVAKKHLRASAGPAGFDRTDATD